MKSMLYELCSRLKVQSVCKKSSAQSGHISDSNNFWNESNCPKSTDSCEFFSIVSSYVLSLSEIYKVLTPQYNNYNVLYFQFG
jgi:hypothetical protein